MTHAEKTLIRTQTVHTVLYLTLSPHSKKPFLGFEPASRNVVILCDLCMFSSCSHADYIQILTLNCPHVWICVWMAAWLVYPVQYLSRDWLQLPSYSDGSDQ